MHENEILALAARQYGLAHQKQLASYGVGPSGIRHLLNSKRWIRRTGHVLQLAGTPASTKQEAMLAVLDLNPDGSALSHQSSAARWATPGFQVRPFHVIGDRLRGRNGAGHIGIVHQPRLLLPDHVLMLDGIPTVSPTLTLFHLAGVLRWPQQVERAMDNMLAAGLTSVPMLARTLERYARRGRPGTALMRALIEARLDHYVPCASGLESRFDELARKCGFRNFVRQLDVGDDYDWLGRVDFVDRKLKIVVEVQSARFHSSLLDEQRDRLRIASLRAAGWIVVEVAEHDLWHEPRTVTDALLAARRERFAVPA
jgi:very-short-patch-repair endonuclease